MTPSKNAGGLQELASSALPALGGDPLQPSWSRSLQELMAANQALIGTSGPPQPTAAAQVLLGGSSRTDFGSLVASLETPGNKNMSTGTKTATVVSLEERCRKHRDGIIERILKKEREHSQRAFEKAIERRREEDWAKEREWWMKEMVGKRNLVDSTNHSLSLGPSESSTLPILSGPTSSSNLLPGYASHSNLTLNNRLAAEHGKLVKSLPAGTSSDLGGVVAHFESIASALDDSNAAAGYTTAWQLMASMMPRLSSPIDGALGALIHFCKQYQCFIKNRVASASLAGQDLSTRQNFGSGMAGTVAAYVKLEKGSNASIWCILYYCLRCGDAVAARDVLNVGTIQENFPEQALVQRVISNLGQLQRNASCVWETGNPLISRQDNAAMEDLYEKTRNLEPENTFKIGVLALLSGNELASFETIEDYLFGRLWLALQSDNPPPQIENIGASIRKYGPEYFGGAEENGGWGYALPLLATQQFKTALTFLAEAGGSTGLLQATHLGLVLSMGGIPLEDLGRPSSSTGDLATALLVKYATTLEHDPALGVGAALEYLLRIPSKERSHKEIAELLCRSPHLVDQLAGIMKDDGARQPGELDKHLDSSEVDVVLFKTAENFRRHAQDRSKAELAAKLFMLAGKYSSLISLLNELITPTDKDDDNKRYWWTQSQQFYAHYLSQRSLALASLERENNMKLVDTNRTLMEFRYFFSSLRNEQYQETFEMIKRLNILPLQQEEVNEKESIYKDMEPILKEQFPALLTGAVHCLHGMHRRIKSESRGVDESVEFQLKDLQKKARFLYIFSGLTNMPNSTKQDIQRLRNNMI